MADTTHVRFVDRPTNLTDRCEAMERKFIQPKDVTKDGIPDLVELVPYDGPNGSGDEIVVKSGRWDQGILKFSTDPKEWFSHRAKGKIFNIQVEDVDDDNDLDITYRVLNLSALGGCGLGLRILYNQHFAQKTPQQIPDGSGSGVKTEQG